jgi:hypothetical protein
MGCDELPESRMPGNPLGRFDGGRVGRTARCRPLSYSTGSAARFSLEHARRLTSSFMERGNLIRRPGAAHLGRRQAGRPVAHCIDARKTAVRNQRGAVSFHRVRAPTDVVVHGAMRRPGAAHLSRRQAGRPVAHCRIIGINSTASVSARTLPTGKAFRLAVTIRLASCRFCKQGYIN